MKIHKNFARKIKKKKEKESHDNGTSNGTSSKFKSNPVNSVSAPNISYRLLDGIIEQGPNIKS